MIHVDIWMLFVIPLQHS